MSESMHVAVMEILTEGSNARLPRTFRSLAPVAGSIARQHRNWVRHSSITGFGVGHKLVNGINTNDLAVRIYVRQKFTPAMSNPLIPSSINIPGLGTVKTDVIETGTLKLQSHSRHPIRPAPGGCSVGWGLVSGTLGLIVNRKSDSGVYLLSNSHVIAKSGLLEQGSELFQPAPIYDPHNNECFARLTEFVPIKFGENTWPNRVDAAIAKLVNKEDGNKSVLGIGDVPAIGKPKRKMMVRKSGSSTDVTHGEIIDIHFKGALDYPSDRFGSTDKAGFREQILVTKFSEGGDSGSLVVNKNNKAVGLLFAGTDKHSVCNRIDTVFDLLKLEL